MCEQEWPLIFSGRPGRARLAWDGVGITPGSLENLTLDLDRTLEVEMAIGLDAAELPSQEPLIVTVKGLEKASPQNNTVDELEVAALLPAGDGERDDRPTVLPQTDDLADRIELDYGWRRAARLIAWPGTHQVSRPTAIPPRGSLAVTLEPAGMVVIVPRQWLGEGMGTLRIRRADDLPFLWIGHRDYPVVRRSAWVGAGDLVGPLPAGRHVFEVELTGHRLPDATVDVRPGRVSVLHLRW